MLGRFESLEPIRQTILKYDNGAAIRVGDVADVEMVLEKNIHFDLCKGKPSMTFVFKREVGANILDIMDDVRAQIADLNGPDGVLRQYRTTVINVACGWRLTTRSIFISALGLVRDNLFLGGSLAVLVLLLFLRSVRPTLIIARGDPDLADRDVPRHGTDGAQCECHIAGRAQFRGRYGCRQRNCRPGKY